MSCVLCLRTHGTLPGVTRPHRSLQQQLKLDIVLRPQAPSCLLGFRLMLSFTPMCLGASRSFPSLPNLSFSVLPFRCSQDTAPTIRCCASGGQYVATLQDAWGPEPLSPSLLPCGRYTWERPAIPPSSPLCVLFPGV